MGDFEARREPAFHGDNLPLEQTQALMAAVLVAFFKQQLHAETDAQQGLPLRRLAADKGRHAGVPKFFCRVPEGTDAGQNQPVRLRQFRRVAADEGFLSDAGAAGA